MTRAAKMSRLVETKMALCRKYENLARISNSQPRRVTLLNRADFYRRQAQMYSNA